MPCLRNHRLRIAQVLSPGPRSAPPVPESRRNRGVGGGGKGVRLRPGPKRPLGGSPSSAIVHPSLGPGEGTCGSGAAELRALQTAAGTVPPSHRFLGPRPAWARALGPGARSPESLYPSGSQRTRAEPSDPLVRAQPLRRLSGPTWERRGRAGLHGTCQQPWPLRSPPPGPSLQPHVGLRGQQTWR